jgi:NifU-like protein involved in Fe-S cluster formation
VGSDLCIRARAWLDDEGPAPDWPDLTLVAPARAYPARHGAMLLPWKAAAAALSSAAPAG